MFGFGGDEEYAGFRLNPFIDVDKNTVTVRLEVLRHGKPIEKNKAYFKKDINFYYTHLPKDVVKKISKNVADECAEKYNKKFEGYIKGSYIFSPGSQIVNILETVSTRDELELNIKEAFKIMVDILSQQIKLYIRDEIVTDSKLKYELKWNDEIGFYCQLNILFEKRKIESFLSIVADNKNFNALPKCQMDKVKKLIPYMVGDKYLNLSCIKPNIKTEINNIYRILKSEIPSCIDKWDELLNDSLKDNMKNIDIHGVYINTTGHIIATVATPFSQILEYINGYPYLFVEIKLN